MVNGSFASFAFVLRPPDQAAQRSRAMPIPLRRRRKNHNGIHAVISRCQWQHITSRFARYFTHRKENKVKTQAQKTVIIPFRVTPAEKKQIEEISCQCNKPMSDFIRECIFKKEIVIIDGADQIADELRRIGNNINQLTKAANAELITVVDLKNVRKELAELWQSLNSLQRNGQ